MPKQEVTPEPLLGMITGFWLTKTITVATELGLFTRISNRGMTLPEIAKKLRIRQRPAKILLNACISLGLLKKSNGQYSTTPLSKTYLTKGRSHYLGDLVLMMGNRHYQGWENLKEIIVRNRPIAVERTDLKQILEFIKAMHGLGLVQAEKLTELIDLSRVKTLLDMGGGSGVYSLVVTKKYPHLKAVVYDRPEVCDVAKQFIRAFKAESQVSVYQGNLLIDNLPQGFDLVLISQVLHEYDPKDCNTLLRKAYHALNKGGKLIINESLLNNKETGPVMAALFSLNMLVHTSKGSSYSGKRIKGWLKKIGFKGIKVQSTPSPLASVTALKPS